MVFFFLVKFKIKVFECSIFFYKYSIKIMIFGNLFPNINILIFSFFLVRIIKYFLVKFKIKISWYSKYVFYSIKIKIFGNLFPNGNILLLNFFIKIVKYFFNKIQI